MESEYETLAGVFGIFQSLKTKSAPGQLTEEQKDARRKRNRERQKVAIWLSK